MGEKLTDRAVKAAKAGPKLQVLWDASTPGFGLRVTIGGTKSFFLRYRRGKKQKWVAIGRYDAARPAQPGEGGSPVWKVESARQEALRLKGRIAEGADPAKERAEDRNALTVEEFFKDYDKRHIKIRKKPSSAAEDRRNFKNHINPAIGHILIKDLTQEDVEDLHSDMAEKPYAANRCRALISHMCRKAEKWGKRPQNSNPCTHVEPYKEEKNERHLSPAEFARLGEVLRDVEESGEEDPFFIALVRLLIFSGARLSEVRTAKWSYFDKGAQLLRLPDSKSNKSKTIALGAPALSILAGLPRIKGNPYIIPGKRPGQPFVGVQKPWQRVRAKAGIENCRIHDLRHSFASVIVNRGDSLFMVGKLLGHADVKTSARYAHLDDNPRLRAADGAAGDIAAAMSGKTGEVVPLKRGKRRKK